MDKNLSYLYYVADANGSESYLPAFNITDGNISGRPHTDFFVFNLPGRKEFELTTTYPGLLIGSGYSHPALEKKDFQLGFFFDHTTGLPVIPGSSVKGVLKSVFPKPGFHFEDKKLEYIRSLLPPAKRDVVTPENWKDIFFKRENPNGKKLAFLDAFISQIPPNRRLFEDDYITPHTKGIFKEPTPIRFLKIGPDIKTKFQFLLYDYEEDGTIITADEIRDVFKGILMEFGIGAKRNVGYGNLVEK